MRYATRVGVIGVFAAGLSGGAAMGVSVLGNGFYSVGVGTLAGDGFGVGTWAAVTGALHPTGGGNDLMFAETGGAISPFTNYSTLRVYEGGGTTDYAPLVPFSGAAGSEVLEQYLASESTSPLGLGFRTVWGVTPEQLEVTQDVFVSGSTFEDSAIYHTVQVRNTGAGAKRIGWRNLYDWQVDDPETDDGPNNQVEVAGGAVVVAATTVEFSHTPGAGEIVRVSIDPGVASYQPLLALGFDPEFEELLSVTVPDEFAYTEWDGAFDSAFDYAVGGVDVSADSAGLSWFGRDLARARVLGPGESVRFTQAIFGVVSQEDPPGPVPEPLSAVVLVGVGTAGLARRGARSG